MNLPSRFGLEYVGEGGEKQTPVMLHRALFGSLERFIGILIEHYAGKFPAWLAPVQVSVLTISERFNDHAHTISKVLEDAGLRVSFDNSKEKVGYKIRQQTLQKTPFMLIIGANEVETGQINLRLLNGEQLSFADIESACEHLKQSCRQADFIE